MDERLRRLIRLRKVDVRCRACGEGAAYARYCFRCGSHDLELLPHGAPGWTHCLGGRSGDRG